MLAPYSDICTSEFDAGFAVTVSFRHVCGRKFCAMHLVAEHSWKLELIGAGVQVLSRADGNIIRTLGTEGRCERVTKNIRKNLETH